MGNCKTAFNYQITKSPNYKIEFLMPWFKRQSGELDATGEKKVRTEGLWVKCEHCRQIIWKKDLDQNFNVCPKCDRHFRIDARTRLSYLLDDGKYEVEDNNLVSTDPLKFTDLKSYAGRLASARSKKPGSTMRSSTRAASLTESR